MCKFRLMYDSRDYTFKLQDLVLFFFICCTMCGFSFENIKDYCFPSINRTLKIHLVYLSSGSDCRGNTRMCGSQIMWNSREDLCDSRVPASIWTISPAHLYGGRTWDCRHKWKASKKVQNLAVMPLFTDSLDSHSWTLWW